MIYDNEIWNIMYYYEAKLLNEFSSYFMSHFEAMFYRHI